MAIKINGATVISDSQAFTSSSTVSATGNITGGNLLTGGSISATGNITGGNILGNVISTGPISTTGNVTGGNILTGGIVSATGNITANYFIGNGSQLTGIDATAIQNGTANVRTFLNGNVTTSAGGTANVLNVTSTGTITSGTASVSGTITGGNIATAGTVSATGNITGGNVSATNLTGTLATASQTNITAVGTLTSLNSGTISSSGNVTGANLLTAGIVSATGDVRTAGNLSLTGNIVDTGPLTISTGSGDIALAPTGNVNISGKNINNLAQPTQNQDAATKIYVDNAVSTAISYHQPVLAATTDTLATTTGGTITYNNGTGGVGATLTTTGAFNLIDTANVQTAGTRILVKNEANAALNGVYVWSNATVITRSADADEYGAGNVDALGLNDYFFVSGGNVNKGSAYVVSAPTGTITFGTSNIQFSQFSSSQTYTANTNAGISLNGTVINAKVDGATTAFDVGGNIIVKASATLTTPNIGAATGISLNVTGNVDSGNLRTTGVVSATGNITGGNVSGTNLTGTLATAAQTNITSVGTLTSLNSGAISSSGNVTGANLLTAGLISATGNITGGNVSGTNLTGTLATAAQPNITSVGTLTSLNSGAISSSGNVTGANLLTAGLISATGNVSGGNLNVTGNIVDTGALSIITGANGNIALAPNGTGIVTVSTAISVTGNVNGANITGAHFGSGAGLTSIPNSALANSSVTVNGTAIALGGSGTVTANASTLTGTVLNSTVVTSSLTSVGTLTSLNSGAISSSGNVTGANFLTGGLISATGAITGAGITGTSLTVSTGTITCGNIVNANGNGVGNIGTSATRFNQVFALASSAQYADLAEKYTADATYPEGTVVSFGGAEEVTISNTDSDSRVAGVISTNPSFRMNDMLESEHTAMVALTGRVPTKVTGTVRKGDLMVSAGNGLARAEANPRVGTVIGKALADHDGAEGVIEVVVGRF